jgi:hypothetical protein
MGDVAVITPEQQAAFTMYSETGQNTNGPMTQKAVTDNLVASSINYDNSQSGLAAENVQNVIDILSDDLVYEGTNKSKGTTKGWYINNSNTLTVTNGSSIYRCYTPEVTPGQRFVIKANADNNAFYAFLTELPSNPQNGDQPSFLEGYE